MHAEEFGGETAVSQMSLHKSETTDREGEG